MIQHIGLTVANVSELKDFYERVLLLIPQYQFKVDKSVAFNIFGVEKEIDVFMMSYQGMSFEIFIDYGICSSSFAHVCLAYKGSELLFSRAQSLGYRSVKKTSRNGYTYFIWDKSGNIFEIKELIVL
ncbi:VOC family protein [Geofilum sp. OHC36d9]|uniref:VOC family protein n=1 Tax=Geofilum sp. OHC36d9 TaxID=3458413 RepID=UPI004034CAD8